MLGKNRKSRQFDIFEVPMENILNPEHDLVIAGKNIPWVDLEADFAGFFSSRGRPSVPVRKIVGLCMLKNRYNVSEEKAINIYLENPYWQFFCGEVHFQKEKPFSSSEFNRFKRRIGEQGYSRLESLTTEYFNMPKDPTYQTYTDQSIHGLGFRIRHWLQKSKTARSGRNR